MKYSLLLFIVGISLIVIGVSNQLSPKCSDKVEVKYVSRDVYDDLLRKSPPTSS